MMAPSWMLTMPLKRLQEPLPLARPSVGNSSVGWVPPLTAAPVRRSSRQAVPSRETGGADTSAAAGGAATGGTATGGAAAAGAVRAMASSGGCFAGANRISTGSPGLCMRMRNSRSVSARMSVG